MDNPVFILFNTKNILLYLTAVNFIAFFLMWYDKRRAREGLWRVKEKTLLLISLAGGAVGALAGMYRFRHKTRHAAFKYGIPAIIALQVFIVIAVKFRVYTDFLNILKEVFKLE